MQAHRFILRLLAGVLPLAFWPGSTSFEVPKVALLFLGAGGLLLASGFRFWRGEQRPALPSKYWLSLAAGGILVAVPAVVRAPHPGLALRTVLLVLSWLVILLSSARAHAHIRELKGTLRVLVLSVTVTCLYALAQLGGLLPGADPATGMPPGISTLGNQNYVAGLAAVTLWPALMLVFSPGAKWLRVAAGASVCVLGGTVILAGATGPQVAMLGAGLMVLVGYLMLRRGHRAPLPRAWGAMFLLIILLMVALTMDGVAGLKTGDETEGRHGPLGHILVANNGGIRATDWKIALAMWQGEPLLGVGAGGYSCLWLDGRHELAGDPAAGGVPSFMPPSSWAHNEYLHILAEFGLLGLGLVIIWLVFAARGWFAGLEGATRAVDVDVTARLLLAGGVWTVLIHSLVSFPLHLPATALALALLPGRPVRGGARVWRPLPGRAAGLLACAVGAFFMVLGPLGLWSDVQMVRGKRHYTAGRWDAADAVLSRGMEVALWPGHGYLYRGLARRQLGRLEEAADDLRESLRTDPTYEALVQLAELEMERGDYPVTRKLAARVLACDPYLQYQHQARFLLGRCALYEGDHPQARSIFTELLREDRDNHRAHLALGYLEALAGRNQAAARHYRQALVIVEEKLAVEGAGKEVGELQMLRQHRQTIGKALASLGAVGSG